MFGSNGRGILIEMLSWILEKWPHGFCFQILLSFDICEYQEKICQDREVYFFRKA